jgi:hypothetical protein
MDFNMAQSKQNRSHNPINYKIFILIFAGVILFQILLTFLGESDLSNNLVFSASVVSTLAAAITAFVIAHEYRGTKIMGKAYFSLGIAYFSVFLAEVTYVIYEEFLGLDPYPSIADVFFFSLYPFTLIHLISNIRTFGSKLSSLTKMWLVLFPISMVTIYILFSLQIFEETNFDFYYGVIFVSGSIITISFAVIGAKIFRKSELGAVWLVLVLGILLTTVGDVWYYHLEVLGENILLICFGIQVIGLLFMLCINTKKPYEFLEA